MPMNTVMTVEAGTATDETELDRLDDETLSSVSTKDVPLELPQRPDFVRHIRNPCCCSLQYGVLCIALIEMILYAIGLGLSAYWYNLIILNFPYEDSIKEGDSHGHSDVSFYLYHRRRGNSIQSTNDYIALMALTQIILFGINILLSFGLAICAIRRIGILGKGWIAGIILTSIGRLAIMLLAPMYVFEFGLMTLLFEMYYMWCVYCYTIECKLYPNGVDYDNDEYLPWVQPVELEPVFASHNFGYRMVNPPPPLYYTTVVSSIPVPTKPVNPRIKPLRKSAKLPTTQNPTSTSSTSRGRTTAERAQYYAKPSTIIAAPLYL